MTQYGDHYLLGEDLLDDGDGGVGENSREGMSNIEEAGDTVGAVLQTARKPLTRSRTRDHESLLAEPMKDPPKRKNAGGKRLSLVTGAKGDPPSGSEDGGTTGEESQEEQGEVRDSGKEDGSDGILTDYDDALEDTVAITPGKQLAAGVIGTPATDVTRQQDETVLSRAGLMGMTEKQNDDDLDANVPVLQPSPAPREVAKRPPPPIEVDWDFIATVNPQGNSQLRPLRMEAGDKGVKPKQIGGETPAILRPDPTGPYIPEGHRKGNRYNEKPAEVRFSEERSVRPKAASIVSEGEMGRQQHHLTQGPPRPSSEVGASRQEEAPERRETAARARCNMLTSKAGKQSEALGGGTATEWFYIKPTDPSPGGELFVTDKLMDRLRLIDQLRQPDDDWTHYANLPPDLTGCCKPPVVKVCRKGVEDRFYTYRNDGAIIWVYVVTLEWLEFYRKDFYKKNGRLPDDLPIDGEKPRDEPIQKPQQKGPSSVADLREFDDDDLGADGPGEHRTSTGMGRPADQSGANAKGDKSGRMSPLESALTQIMAEQQKQNRELVEAMREMRASPVPHQESDNSHRHRKTVNLTKLRLTLFSGADYVHKRLVQYQDWVREYVIKAESEGADETQMAEKLVSFLTGAALEAYMGLPRETRKSWALVNAAMTEKFDPDNTALAIENLRTLRMGENESPADFFSQVKRRAKRAHPKIPEEFMDDIWKESFVNGLPDRMQDVLVLLRFAKLTAEQCVAEVEACDQSQRAVRPRVAQKPAVAKEVNAVNFQGGNQGAMQPYRGEPMQQPRGRGVNPRPPPRGPPPTGPGYSSWENSTPRNPSPSGFRPSGQAGTASNPQCYFCEEFGHISRFCPYKGRPVDPQGQQEMSGRQQGKPPLRGGPSGPRQSGFGGMGFDQTMTSDGRLSPTRKGPTIVELPADGETDGATSSQGAPAKNPKCTTVQRKKFMGELMDLPPTDMLIPTGTCEATEVLPGESVSESRKDWYDGRIEHVGENPVCQEFAARMKAEFTKADWDQIWVLASWYNEENLKQLRLGFEAARLGLERRIITYQVSSKAKYYPTIDVHLGMDALLAMLRGTIMGLVAARVFELFRRRLNRNDEMNEDGGAKPEMMKDQRLADAVNTVSQLNDLAREEQTGKLKRPKLLCDLEATDCESDESAPEDDDEEPKRKKKRVSTMAKLARCPMDAAHILDVKNRASEYIEKMTGQPFTPTVNVVQTQVEEFEDDDQPPVFVRGRVGHVECLVMLDTGANVSLVSAEFIRRYFPDAKLSAIKGDPSCAGYDGQKFGLEGLVTLRVRVAHQSHDILFHVSTGGKHEVLLGGNWMKVAGLVAFDVAGGYVAINDAPRLPVWPRLRRQVCTVHVAGNQTVRKGHMQYLKVKPDASGPLEQDWVFNQSDHFTQATGLISLSTLVSGTDADKSGFWIPVINADRDNVRLKNNMIIGRIDYSAYVAPVVNRIAVRNTEDVEGFGEAAYPSGSDGVNAHGKRVLSVLSTWEEPFADKIVEREGQELVEETFYLPQGVTLRDGLTEKEKYQITRLLHLKREAFAEGENDLGWCKMMKFHIDTGNAKPIKTTPRRLRVIHQQRLREYIQEQVKLGVIEPSKSPWSHNVVIVPKKGGPDRVCIDFRPVNEVTVKDAFPLPRIDDTLDRLTGSKIYAAVDLKAGYNQIEVDEESKEKTAFVAEGGFWQYTRMPFGLVNAPAACQRLMEMVLAGLNWEIVLIYLDDGIIFAKDFAQLLERVEIVLNRVITAGLKLSGKKCQFAMTSVKYLGHVVSGEGVQADPETLRKIKEIPVPTCKKHVRSFMGLASYYRRFGGKQFARESFPLNQLTQKEIPFIWTEECQHAFEWVKDMLCSKPVAQPFPDYNRPFYVCTDASAYAIGAVLEQRDDEGRPTILHAASRLLTPAERTHGAVTREAEAIYFAFKKFDALIYGRHVTVLTDQGSLTYWPTKELFANQRTLEMWLTLLCQYDFKIVHRAGVDNGNADALSRPPLDDEDERSGQSDLRQDVQDLIETLVTEERLDVYQQYEVGCGAMQSTLIRMSRLDDKEKEGREWEKFTRRVQKEDRRDEEKRAVHWEDQGETSPDLITFEGETEPVGVEPEETNTGETADLSWEPTGESQVQWEVNTVQKEMRWRSEGDWTKAEVAQQHNRLRRHTWGGESKSAAPPGTRVGKLMRDVETGDLYRITAEMLDAPTWVRADRRVKTVKPRVCSIFGRPLKSVEELMQQYERSSLGATGQSSEPLLFRDDHSRVTDITKLPDLGAPVAGMGDFWAANMTGETNEMIPASAYDKSRRQSAWRDRDMQPYELATEYAEQLEQMVRGVELTGDLHKQKQMVKTRFLQGLPTWMRKIAGEICIKPIMTVAAALNIWQIRRNPRLEEGVGMVMREDEKPVEFAQRLNGWEGGDERYRERWEVTSPGRMYRYIAGMPDDLRAKVAEERPVNYLEAVRVAAKWNGILERPSGRGKLAKVGEQRRLQQQYDNRRLEGPIEKATPVLLGRTLRRSETPSELLGDIKKIIREVGDQNSRFGRSPGEKEEMINTAFWAAIPEWIKDRLTTSYDVMNFEEMKSAMFDMDRIIQDEDLNAWIATHRKLRYGETVEDFADKLAPLVEFICPEADPQRLGEALVRRFIAGLPGYLMERVRNARPRTLEKAVSVASLQTFRKGADGHRPYCFMITRGQKRLQAAATGGKDLGEGHSAAANDVVMEVEPGIDEATLDFRGEPGKSDKSQRTYEPEDSLDPHDYCPVCGKWDATEGSDGADMIFCDKCEYWHHCNCVSVSREEAEKPGKWYCAKCIADRQGDEQQRTDALTAFEHGEDVHARVESEILISSWDKDLLISQQRADQDFDVIFQLRAGEVVQSMGEGDLKKNQLLTADHFEVIDGLLYHKHLVKGKGKTVAVHLQLCIPREKRDEAMFSMHDSKLCGGHLGLAKVIPRLNAVYYWPTMFGDAKQYIASCDKCQQRKGPQSRSIAPLNPIPNVGVPLTRWVVDLVGPLPKTARGHKYIVVFIDQFTKFVVARPLVDKTAKGVAEAFLVSVICEYGPPKELQSDLGKEFIAIVMKELCRMLGIRQYHSTAYRPSTNGLVERFNRTLGRMLSMYVNAEQRDWDLNLPYVIHAYRNAVQSSTGVSPFFMVFGVEPRLLLPGDYAVGPEADMSVAEFLAEREQRMRTTYQLVKRSIADNQRKQKHFHDRKSRQVTFKVGDSVWCYSPVVGCHRCAKFTWHWHGPFDIMEVDKNGVNYVIKRNDGKKPDPLKNVHVERLWKRTSREQTQLEGVSICSDQRHPVIAEAIYDPTDIGEGPAPNSLPNGERLEVNVVTFGDPEGKCWVPGVPTFNGRGNFEEWVTHLEMCYDHLGHRNELGNAVKMEMFLTGAALDIYEDLDEGEQESWEACKVAMSRQLKREDPDSFGAETTSWGNISTNPPTFKSSTVPALPSTVLLKRLKSQVRVEDQEGIELWCELFRRARNEETNEQIVDTNAARAATWEEFGENENYLCDHYGVESDGEADDATDQSGRGDH